MHSSVKTLDGNRVRLTVEVDEAELEAEITAAFQRMARQVRVPGFRPGKAPRRVLEARLGYATGRAEALRACMPDYYARAIAECDVDAIDEPEVEVIHGEQVGPLRFDAVVKVRPVVSVSGYDGLRVEIPSPDMSSEEVDMEVHEFRQQFAELVTTDRPAADGDHLRINIACTLDGEDVVGLNSSDYDYEITGESSLVPEIDDNLRGASAGDVLAFRAASPDHDPDDDGRMMECKVLVKEVRETVLPDFDDEFVSANSEYSTVEQFREAAHEAGSARCIGRSAAVRGQAAAAAIAALVDDEIPDGMLRSGTRARFDAMEKALQYRGYTLEEYFSIAGRSEHDLASEFYRQADQEARIDLALRAVAMAEGLEADDAVLDVEIRRLIAGPDATELDAEAVPDSEMSVMRKALEDSGRLREMRAGLSKRAALSWIEERMVLVDETGVEISAELVDMIERYSEQGQN